MSGSLAASCSIIVILLVLVLRVLSAPKDSPNKFLWQAHTEEYSIVATKYGKVRGFSYQVDAQTSLDVFLGIPYAKPPVGNLRFARPEPPTPWNDIQDALKFGNQCSQRPLDKSPQADVPYSEDCLYLNIYAPRINSSTSKLPVMFWIHGGGYYGGTGAIYNGTELALRGVVVVTINYRLDVLGFLSTADSIIPGNFGMLDQVLAMDWVQDNIAAFGGDRNDVTIFGESAGASSVSLHLLSPLSRGKFHKAIQESGSSLCYMWAVNRSNTTYYAPKPFAQLIGLAVGCSHQKSEELLSCLRRIHVDYLINASIGIETSLHDALVWVPVVETTFGFLPDLPINLYKRGEVADVPTIRGYNQHEVAVSIKDPDNKGFSLAQFAEMVVTSSYFFFQKNTVAVTAAIEAVYIANQTDPIGRRSDYERMMSDIYMIAPTSYEAQLHSKIQKKSKSYLYEFSYRASFSSLPKWMGAVHTDELPFVFGLPRGPANMKYNTTDPSDLKVADVMVTLWTNFAKTGNPTPPAVPSHDQSLTFQDTHKATHQKINSHETKAAITGSKGMTSHMSPAAEGADAGLVWTPMNDDNKAVLEINVDPQVGHYFRSSAVELWMVTIPRLEEL